MTKARIVQRLSTRCAIGVQTFCVFMCGRRARVGRSAGLEILRNNGGLDLIHRPCAKATRLEFCRFTDPVAWHALCVNCAELGTRQRGQPGPTQRIRCPCSKPERLHANGESSI